MYKTELDEYIETHREEMLRDIMELIRIDSVKSEPKPGMPFGEKNARVLQKAEKLLASYGFQTRNYDNYVITADLAEGERKLDLLAHLDVVPAGNDWSVTEPFSPVIQDGKLYGRGSADDKGPALAAVYAMRAVRELKLPLSGNVRLILGSDEESGSDDIAYYYQKEKAAPMTLSPDAQFPLVNIEKGILHGQFQGTYEETEKKGARVEELQAGTGINVVPGQAQAVLGGISEEKLEMLCAQAEEQTGIRFTTEKEGNRIRLTVHGNSCHASLPDTGNNALTGLLTVLTEPVFQECGMYSKLQALHTCFPHGDFSGQALGAAMSDELSGAVEISLTQLTCKDGQVTGGFDSRTPLCATNENFRDVIRRRMEADGLHLGDRGIYAPHHVPEDTPFVQKLLDCCEMYEGKREKPLVIGGGSYVHAIPGGVAFGCADPRVDNHMHGKDEFAEIEQLVKSAKIYAQAIVRLCGKE